MNASQLAERSCDLIHLTFFFFIHLLSAFLQYYSSSRESVNQNRKRASFLEQLKPEYIFFSNFFSDSLSVFTGSNHFKTFLYCAEVGDLLLTFSLRPQFIFDSCQAARPRPPTFPWNGAAAIPKTNLPNKNIHLSVQELVSCSDSCSLWEASSSGWWSTSPSNQSHLHPLLKSLIEILTEHPSTVAVRAWFFFSFQYIIVFCFFV